MVYSVTFINLLWWKVYIEDFLRLCLTKFSSPQTLLESPQFSIYINSILSIPFVWIFQLIFFHRFSTDFLDFMLIACSKSCFEFPRIFFLILRILLIFKIFWPTGHCLLVGKNLVFWLQFDDSFDSDCWFTSVWSNICFSGSSRSCMCAQNVFSHPFLAF